MSVVLRENIIWSEAQEDYVVVVHYYKFGNGVSRGRVLIQDQDTNSQGRVPQVSFLGPLQSR